MDKKLTHEEEVVKMKRNFTYAIAPHINTPAVGVVCHCKANAGLRHSPRGLHTRTRLSSLLKLNLDSSLKTTWFLSAVVQFPRVWHHFKLNGAKDDLVSFRCSPVSSRVWHHFKLNRRHNPKCPSARHLCMVREDTGASSEELSVPGWRPMMQSDVRVHFLRCGGLLDYWSVEGILNLVFV
ncbi:e3 ubiquitin-protein ligase RNF13 [Trichonephila clavipes]|nr:e3 ubiquitin-protein ligase RNF13 [Trichonephila clavipes]